MLPHRTYTIAEAYLTVPLERSTGAWLQESLALAQAGQMQQAKTLLKKLFAAQDVGSHAHALFGQILAAEGQHALAQEHLSTAIEGNQTVPDWHQALGDCLLAQKIYGAAISAYARAVELEPRLTAAWFNRGICYQQIGNLVEARDAFSAAMNLEPNAPDILNNYGAVSFQLNDIDAATNAYESAAEIEPENPDLLANLALCYEVANRPADAERAASAARALQNDCGLALLVLGRLKMQEKAYSAAIELFDQGIVRSTTQFAFSFEINKAQCFDRLGDYAAAIRSAVRAHAHNMKQPDHGPSMHRAIATVTANARFFLGGKLQRPNVPPRSGERMAPVFFVGFPRSGTTLVERILAHHPQIFAAPETTPLAGVHDWLKQSFPNDAYPDVLGRLSKEQVVILRQVYWDWMDRRFGTRQEPVFVDKMPMNILAVGLIDWIFPDARILCALRDPRDVIVSCYFQDFAQNLSTSTFSTLSSTAEYYRKVMDFWMRMKPDLRPAVYEYRYEDLVANTEASLRSIFEFIGVDWRPDSLAYQDNLTGQHIRTPSRAQIKEPISARSVGRWKNYADDMARLDQFYQPVLRAYYERSAVR